MGQTPKSKLEALKRERRQAKAARKRAEKVRSMQVRFLIVCEGTQTEPLYFKALSKVRRSAVAEVREGDIVGLGRSTCVLVRDTKKLRDQLERERGLRFDRVWVVFDKDDNPDFNDAITLAEKCGINCAWSNEAFELWYVLHFVRLDTAIDRSAYIRILEREVRRHAGYGNY